MTKDSSTMEDLSLKTVTIEVNDHKVEMPAGPATGLEIKDAAIKQGVNIQQNFVLQVELPNGSSRVIGNDDKVPLTEHLAFTAIAADDNS
jgi:hypothetical protein